MRRVTRGPVVILSGDPDKVREFWLYDYCREVLDAEARRYPSIPLIAAALGEGSVILPVPIPLNCVDGFNEGLLRPTGNAAGQGCTAGLFGLDFR